MSKTPIRIPARYLSVITEEKYFVLYFLVIVFILVLMIYYNKVACRGAGYFVQKGYFGFEIMRLSGGITTILLYKKIR